MKEEGICPVRSVSFIQHEEVVCHPSIYCLPGSTLQEVTGSVLQESRLQHRLQLMKCQYNHDERVLTDAEAAELSESRPILE